MKARISVRLVRINLYMYYNYSLSISFRMLRYKLHILEAYIFIDIVERPIYHKHYWYYFTLTYLKVGNTLHLSRLPINGLEQCLYFVYFALNCLKNIMSLKKNLHWCHWSFFIAKYFWTPLKISICRILKYALQNYQGETADNERVRYL